MKPLVSNLVAEKLSLQNLTDLCSCINPDCFGNVDVSFSLLQKKIRIVSNAATCCTSNIVTAFC